MSRLRLVFFGTPEHAAAILENLSSSDRYEIAAVVTNPDAPAGRGQKLSPSPVKERAGKLEIPVLTPAKLDQQTYDTLQKLAADLFIVVMYGKIFPSKFLALSRLGTFNLHPSLLPKYRGASPVQSALLNGEKTSGITIFRLTPQMDAGDIYVQEKIDLDEKTATEVFEEVTVRGGELLRQFCEDIVSGKGFSPQKQNESEATYSRKFSKSDGQIFPEKETSEEILRKYRAFSIWPQIYYIDSRSGKRIKFLKIQKYEGSNSDQNGPFIKHQGKCLLRTKDGYLEILEAQPEGKKVMSGSELFNCLPKN